MFMHPRKNKMPWLSKLPVLFVYLLFFTVQLFFNFGVAQSSVSSTYHKQHSARVAHVHARAISSKSIGRNKIRLNKRFEPSVIPGIAVPAIIITVVHISPKTMGHYICQYYPEVFLSDYSLRGPPVVA